MNDLTYIDTLSTVTPSQRAINEKFELSENCPNQIENIVQTIASQVVLSIFSKFGRNLLPLKFQ